MLYLVLFLVLNISLFVQANKYSNENYNIYLNLTALTYSATAFEITQRTFVVLNKKPFDIVLVNYEASGITCKWPPWSHIVGKYSLQNEGSKTNSVFKVTEAKEFMTGVWNCTIKRSEKKFNLDLTFKVHVKSQKLELKINGRKQHTSIPETPVLSYAEIVNFMYKDGEKLDLACSNKENDDGHLYLRYSDSRGTPLVITNELDDFTIIFEKTLYAKNDKDVIDCVYVQSLDELETIYRVMLIRVGNDERNDNITITINNKRLIPTASDSVADEEKQLNFHFTYTQDQLLTVSCEVSKNLNYPHFLEKDNLLNLTQLTSTENQSWRNTIVFSTEKFEKKEHLICAANADKKTKVKADILFEIRGNRNLQILGLNTNDVIQEYTYMNNIWVIDYQYNVGNTVNITCVSKNTKPLNLYESLEPSENSKDIVDTKRRSRIITLTNEHNGTLIICQAGMDDQKDMMKSIIHLHLNTSAELDDTAITAGIIEGAQMATSDANNIFEIIIIGVATLFILVIITILTIFFYRRHLNAKNKHNIEINKLTDQPEEYATPEDCINHPENAMKRNSLYWNSDSKVIENDDDAIYHYVNADGQLQNASIKMGHTNQRNKKELKETRNPNYCNMNVDLENSETCQNNDTYEYDYVYSAPWHYKE